ncbi:hypothetical protein D3C78_1517360 [compost metagenome]
MATGHRTTVRQLLRTFKSTVDTRFSQPNAYFLRAQVTAFGLFGQQLHHRWVLGLYPETHDMNLVIFPQRGDLYAINQLQRQRQFSNAGGRCGQAGSGVMIGNSQNAYPHFNRSLHQLRRRQITVRGGGVAV